MQAHSSSTHFGQEGDVAIDPKSLFQAPLRVVFMGTPDFAATILNIVKDAPFINVVAVYTQPDRPAGRGNRLQASAVKTLALEYNLPVYQPMNFSASSAGDEAYNELATLKPDVLLVAAYGLILPQRVLDIPRLMPINVHASLLPKYRGAAPIQRAIMNGEVVTGITIMRMEAGLDTGPILMQRAVGIDINDTSGSLHGELAREGGQLLVQALDRLRCGTIQAILQDDSLSSYAAKLVKADGLIDFSLSVAAIHASIRGVTPHPGARMILRRAKMDDILITTTPGIYPLPVLEQLKGGHNPGIILGLHEDALLVACADGAYAFSSLRPAGKNAMSGRAFFNGYIKGHTGASFG